MAVGDREPEDPTLSSPRVVWLTEVLSDSRVLGTDMRCELLVALVFVVHDHPFNGFSHQRSYRVERPRAFGASPTQKILPFDPYQFAMHRVHGTPRDLPRSCFSERRRNISLPRHCSAKAPRFMVLNEVLPESPLLEHASKQE